MPPGYQLREPPRRPKLDGYTGIIDRILEEDSGVHRKQRHTVKRIREYPNFCLSDVVGDKRAEA